jgi:hypothetical protein
MRLTCSQCKELVIKDHYFSSHCSKDGVYYIFCSKTCRCDWIFSEAREKESYTKKESPVEFWSYTEPCYFSVARCAEISG